MSANDSTNRLIRWTEKSASKMERILAVAILAGVAAFAVFSIQVLVSMDWGETDTFYEMIYRVLLMVIGVELARTLLTHDLEAILELLAFVVARKMLKPDVSGPDILMSVVGFSVLLAARYYWLGKKAMESAPSVP